MTRPFSHAGEVFRRKLSKLDDAQCDELRLAIAKLLHYPDLEERSEVIRTLQQLELV